MGGTSAAGGAATGGSQPVAGNSSLGGASSTGGTGTAVAGNSSIGGTGAVGGGASATGGTTSLSADLQILQAHDPTGECVQCATRNCSANLGVGAPIDEATLKGSCLSDSIVALSYAAKKADPLTTGTSNMTTVTPIYSFAKGDTVTGDKLCLDLLNCQVVSKCNSTGVYLTGCYCGAAIGSDCLDGTNFVGGDGDPTNPNATNPLSTGPINGPCVIEEQNAANSTSGSIPLLFAEMTVAAGPANALQICLFNNHCTTCL